MLFSASGVSIGDGKRSFETVYRRVVIPVPARMKTPPARAGTARAPTISSGPGRNVTSPFSIGRQAHTHTTTIKKESRSSCSIGHLLGSRMARSAISSDSDGDRSYSEFRICVNVCSSQSTPSGVIRLIERRLTGKGSSQLMNHIATSAPRLEPSRVCIIKPSSLGRRHSRLAYPRGFAQRWPTAHLAWVVSRSFRDIS